MTREAIFGSKKLYFLISAHFLDAWSQLLTLAIARRCFHQRYYSLDFSCPKRRNLRLKMKVLRAKVLLGMDFRFYLSVLKVVFILEESRAREIVVYGLNTFDVNRGLWWIRLRALKDVRLYHLLKEFAIWDRVNLLADDGAIFALRYHKQTRAFLLLLFAKFWFKDFLDLWLDFTPLGYRSLQFGRQEVLVLVIWFGMLSDCGWNDSHLTFWVVQTSFYLHTLFVCLSCF